MKFMTKRTKYNTPTKEQEMIDALALLFITKDYSLYTKCMGQ